MASPHAGVVLVLLLLAAGGMLADPTSAGGLLSSMESIYSVGEMEGSGMRCVGSECYVEYNDEEVVEGERRQLLARRRRFLSYDMLKRDQVPCNRRGVSYYNCLHRGQANPYRRGCSYITRCARDLR